MTSTTTKAGLAGLGQRLSHKWARFRSQPGALLWQPEPPTLGDATAGRRLSQGIIQLAGQLIETDAPDPWTIMPPSAGWAELLHGHGWLDDLAAANAWDVAGTWVWAWIEHSNGRGPAWVPELVARRLSRWLCYASRLLQAQDPARSRVFFDAIEQHARNLVRNWRRAAPGRARIEALSGLIYALLSLEASTEQAPGAIAELDTLIAETIAPDGATPSRNPEDLVAILDHLAWIERVIAEAGHEPTSQIRAATGRANAVIATLRHADGGFARFHGAGLATGKLPDRTIPTSMAMGYARLSACDTIVIVDCGPAPGGPHRATAHASALAFEVSTGAGPLVANRGPGYAFGPVETDLARRTAAHSGIEIANLCAAELLDDSDAGTGRSLVLPGHVSGRLTLDESGHWVLGESEVYRPMTGLSVERRLHLEPDGNRISGEDTVLATAAEARALFAARFPDKHCRFDVRLLVHPDVRTTIALGGKAALLSQPDGTQWLFRPDGGRLRLAPGTYHQAGRLRPRATQEIVVSADIIEYWGRLTWSLTRIA